MNIEVLWDGTYGLSSLSEKTRKSNRLQMVRPGFEPTTSRTVVRYSTNWANRSAVSTAVSLEIDLLIL